MSQNIKAITEDEFYKKFNSACESSWVQISTLSCEDFKTCKDSTMEMSVTNSSPDLSDTEKQITRDSINNDVERLIKMADCISFKYFLIYLGEGIYINQKDKLPYGSKTFFKKAPKLNTNRFIALYGQKLTAAFPNKKFFIVDWGW